MKKERSSAGKKPDYPAHDALTGRGGRAAEALRASEVRYRSLFENMTEGFAYCRMIFADGGPQDFVYLAVNEAFEKLTGLRDIKGKRATEAIPE